MAKLTPLQKARRKWIIKKRRELGLCVFCGAEAPDNPLCDRCNEKKTERQRASRAKRKADNLCRDCGKVKVEQGQWRCDECVTKKYGNRICHAEGCVNVAERESYYCGECQERTEWAKSSCNVYFIRCPDCDVLFTATYKGKLRCYECQTKRNSYNPVEKYEKECPWCGEMFWGNSIQKFCPTKKCQRRYHKKNDSKVSVEYIFNRDNGRCHICNRKLNLERKVPHPMAATRDHIIPVSMGGIDESINVKLACFLCNSTKGNRALDNGEQLLLFG